MGFSSLPTELIIDILSEIQDLATLQALACTCQVLRSAAESRLYASIFVTKHPNLHRLADAFETSVERRGFVRELGIVIRSNKQVRNEPGQGITGILDLGTLPNLVSFTSESLFHRGNWVSSQAWASERGWDKDQRSYLSLFESASLRSKLAVSERPLQKLKSGVGKRMWFLSAACPIFLHPTLEAVELSFPFNTMENNERDRLRGLAQYTHQTPLKSLRLIECMVAPEALETILSFPKALESFHYSETSVECEIPVATAETISAFNDPTHGDVFNRAIAQQSHSLRRLGLRGNRMFSQTCPLRLGSFVVLSVLRLEWSPCGEDTPRWVLLHPVPRSLDALHLHDVVSPGATTTLARIDSLLSDLRVGELIAIAASRGIALDFRVATHGGNRYSYFRIECFIQMFDRCLRKHSPLRDIGHDDAAQLTMAHPRQRSPVPLDYCPRGPSPRFRAYTAKFVRRIPLYLHGEPTPRYLLQYDSQFPGVFLKKPICVDSDGPDGEDGSNADRQMIEAMRG